LDFEGFREKFASDYEQLGRRIAVESIVAREELAGMYYPDEDERGGEEGLVST
jgi:hypothetical protein